MLKNRLSSVLFSVVVLMCVTVFFSCKNLSDSTSDSDSSTSGTTDTGTNTEVPAYTITYNLDGGTNSDSNPSSYAQGTGVTFAAPAKRGYTFDGWYSDSSFTTAVSAIAAGTTGSITLYAKWTAIQYTI